MTRGQHPPLVGAYSDHWWGCSEPERPYDPLMALCETCDACMMKGELELRHHPDWVAIDGRSQSHMSLAQWMAQSRERRGET